MKKRTMVLLSVVVLAVLTLGSVWMENDTAPSQRKVVIFQCEVSHRGQWVVSSYSGNEAAPRLQPSTEPSCAQVIDDLLNRGMHIKHISEDHTFLFTGG